MSAPPPLRSASIGPSRLQPTRKAALVARIRVMLALVMAALVLSGLTAFPLVRTSGWLLRALRASHLFPVAAALPLWINQVHLALVHTGQTAPFLAYGTDWLAFAHLVLAIAFLGPYRDPLRNRWVIDFGLIACVGVLPLVLIAGPIRQIPVFWRLVDCSFGVLGAIPLLLCRHYLALLDQAGKEAERRRARSTHRRRSRPSRHPAER